jgi:hypothetical protein
MAAYRGPTHPSLTGTDAVLGLCVTHTHTHIHTHTRTNTHTHTQISKRPFVFTKRENHSLNVQENHTLTQTPTPTLKVESEEHICLHHLLQLLLPYSLLSHHLWPSVVPAYSRPFAQPLPLPSSLRMLLLPCQLVAPEEDQRATTQRAACQAPKHHLH